MADANLTRTGFAHWRLWTELGLAANDPNYQALCDAASQLPPDPYDSSRCRHRRYGRGMLLPWRREFHWMPEPEPALTSSYYQGRYNPEFPGAVREWPTLPERVRSNELLQRIVMFDYDQTTWSALDASWPIYVGVHLVALRVDSTTSEAVASPNLFHQDGEPYSFVHLLYRRNILGGINIVAPPRCRGSQPAHVPAPERLAEFALLEPLESYGVADDQVSHYFGPVRHGATAGVGERAVIFVDLVPMRHQI